MSVSKINWADDTSKSFLVGLLSHPGTKSVSVIFTKADDSPRVMNATLNPDLIPNSDSTYDSTKSTKTSNPEVQPVFDLDAQAWRSFRWDSIQNVTIEL